MSERRLRVAPSARDERKRAAAEGAVAAEVRDGMTLGLGSGSTATLALEAVAARLRNGGLRHIVGVPSSEGTAALARRLGIPLTSLEECPVLDVAIDGADEIAPGLALIKGLGGALLREAVVVASARRFAVVADDGKLVAQLGEHTAVPVETIPFAVPLAVRGIAELGAVAELRGGGEPFVTDEGNHIVDARFGPIADPAGLAAALSAIPGVCGHGLFLGVASIAYVGGPAGVEVIEA